jgi:hypothetical protein
VSRRIWPLSLAAREGVATARTGRWTSLLMALAVTWIVAAPGAADAISVSKLMDGEKAWMDAGGYVFVVTGARDGNTQNPVPAPACEALASVDGIGAAFALQRSDATGTLSYIPGGRVSLYDVSAGALDFLGVAPADGGVLLATKGFLERTGATAGDVVTVVRRGASNTVPVTSDPLTIRAVDTAVMGDEFDGALLVPAQLKSTADSCYVRTDAAHVSAVKTALPTLLAYEGKPAIPNPRLFQSDFTVDYTHAYESRALRWVWVPAAALLGLLWAMLQWFRRSHVAIYATFGMKPAARLVMQMGEWGVLAGFGAVWGWGLGVVGALALGAHAAQAVELVTLHGVLTVIGATALVVLLGLRPAGTLLNALKDR